MWSAQCIANKTRKPRLPAILEGRVLESRTEPGDSRPMIGARAAQIRVAPRRPGLNKGTLIAAAARVAHRRRRRLRPQWWTTGRYMVSTDDAYVRAHNTTLAAKISGYVASIPIEDKRMSTPAT